MSVVGAVERLMEQERLGCAITIVNGPDIGQKAVIDIEEGIVAGTLPDDIAADVLADAAELMDREQSRTLVYGDRSVFIETISPQPVMFVFGAGHNAQPLTTMAKLMGFRVIVADARPMWATPERFPDADEVVVGWPDAVFEKFELDRRSYVVLLSHDARFEDPVFTAVQGKKIRYMGAMGSRRTHAMRLERLAALGWTEEQLATINGPIGLDIGAESPPEMAVSVLGEVVQVRYGAGTGLSLLGQSNRIHKQRPEDPT
jgi:xanthine dehydrogenase accessory factor